MEIEMKIKGLMVDPVTNMPIVILSLITAGWVAIGMPLLFASRKYNRPAR